MVFRRSLVREMTVTAVGLFLVLLGIALGITLGPDGKPNTGDEVQPSQAFMVITRAQNQPGADGILGTADDIQDANNTDSPWVDQSQTYTSHSSHQVFLREYINDGAAGIRGRQDPEVRAQRQPHGVQLHGRQCQLQQRRRREQ